MIRATKAAKELGLTAATLTRYAKQGCPHKADHRGRMYDVDDVREWMKENGISGKPGTQKKCPSENANAMEEAKLRKEQANALSIEIRNRKAMGELIEASEAKALTVRLALVTRTAMIQLAANIAPQLVGLTAQEIEEDLEEKIREELDRVADGI